jgi:hypothetical protein
MTREEEILSVWKNRELIISKKTNAIKYADVTVIKSNISHLIDKDVNQTTKEANVEVQVVDPTVLRAKLVINTTNLIDSHMDCHIPSIWKKSLQETKQLLLLQEHEMEFEKIIADSLNDEFKAYTKTLTFNELGYDYTGFTEALIFDVQIKKEVNEFMFNLYLKNRVNQHSVGMRYIKIFMCVDSTEPMYSSEKANWDKYYLLVANKDVADTKGYFWAVTEAKVIEGSAVVKGSNECTPVMEIDIEDKNEPLLNTQNNSVPSIDTQKTVTELLQNIPNLIKI